VRHAITTSSSARAVATTGATTGSPSARDITCAGFTPASCAPRARRPRTSSGSSASAPGGGRSSGCTATAIFS